MKTALLTIALLIIFATATPAHAMMTDPGAQDPDRYPARYYGHLPGTGQKVTPTAHAWSKHHGARVTPAPGSAQEPTPDSDLNEDGYPTHDENGNVILYQCVYDVYNQTTTCIPIGSYDPNNPQPEL